MTAGVWPPCTDGDPERGACTLAAGHPDERVLGGESGGHRYDNPAAQPVDTPADDVDDPDPFGLYDNDDDGDQGDAGRDVVDVLLPGDQPATSHVRTVDSDRIAGELLAAQLAERPVESAAAAIGELFAAAHDRPFVVNDRRRVTADLPAEAPAPGPYAVEYVMICRECWPYPVPWPTRDRRDSEARHHADEYAHPVTLAEQADTTGTTITGYIDPTPPARATVPAPRDRRRPPLVAFVAPADGPPDLVCTVTPRAGAAWLVTAAHACLRGRGSLGVEQPHRVMYTGRAARTPLGGWSILIDGVVGATSLEHGQPIGCVFGVDGTDNPEAVEEAAEAYVADTAGLDPDTFGVVLLVDDHAGAPAPDPAPAGR